MKVWAARDRTNVGARVGEECDERAADIACCTRYQHCCHGYLLSPLMTAKSRARGPPWKVSRGAVLKGGQVAAGVGSWAPQPTGARPAAVSV
jgi:hypothetical protein